MTAERPQTDRDDYGFNKCDSCNRVTVPMVRRCPWCGHVGGGGA